VELLPFNEGEIRQYRKAYFGDSDRAENLSSLLSKNLQLETIARVPLMLYYLCTYVESGTAAGIGDNNLREWLASLLERVETRSLNSPRASAKACLRGLIYAWPDNNDRPLLEEDETLSQILSLLGKASRKIKKKEFSGTELDEKLLEILPSGEPQRSAARVRKIVEESGVLIETQRGSDITPPEFAFIEAVRIAYAPRRWVRLSAGVALSIVVLIAFLLWRHWAATPSHTVPTVVAVAPVETEKPTQSVRAPLVEFSQTQASHVSADCTFSGSVADGYASVWVLIRQDTGHDYVVQPAARIIGGRWTVNAKCGNPEDRLLNFHVLAIVDPVSPIEQGQKLRELPEGAGIAGPINVTRR
jgi:hypothetical protein